jgi:hypothetical protein
MSRLIDAVSLIGNMMEAIRHGYNEEDMLSIVNGEPTVDAVPVVHGNWEEIDMRGLMTPGGTPIVRCSVCKDKRTEHLSGVEFPEWRKFCSMCGAKMDGVTE